ncbi:tetratricopeptide repeat protein [Paenalcaligenes niemegkensis]|uniref:YfgM family protein n=1 Tax=Paenalcaligenes niemegkensis TaxID=2895469 RepID=UPI001EE81086|nr:tetratricopeptide repeat protein [Paenalcaligenes niemegkensis]MCQ9616728.1 tetratricopeptide repeat protein [Paenalcaligenes niemegkensis]
MAYDLEEQEKIDAIRDWWGRYGTLCVILAFVVVAGVLGWRGWQWYQNHQNTQAMGYFEALEGASRQDSPEAYARIKAASETLRADFPQSGYTSRGVLIAAWALQERGETEEAREQLEWIISSGDDQALIPLARLRLAGVLLELGDHDQALAQLSDAPASFAGLYADRRGDVYAAQGKKAEAQAEWEKALEALSGEAVSQIIQLKLDATGER